MSGCHAVMAKEKSSFTKQVGRCLVGQTSNVSSFATDGSDYALFEEGNPAFYTVKKGARGGRGVEKRRGECCSGRGIPIHTPPLAAAGLDEALQFAAPFPYRRAGDRADAIRVRL